MLTYPLLASILAFHSIAAEPLATLEAVSPAQVDYAADANEIAALINHEYAYPERLANGRFELTPKLRTEAAQIDTQVSMIRFAERAITLLADHHAITGQSLDDSWAVFPSFGDLWIVKAGDDFVIEQVRVDSPAQSAGIKPGDVLVAIDGISTKEAVSGFWSDLGTTGSADRDAYAVRVLAAGRRDRPRNLSVMTAGSATRHLVLRNLYEVTKDEGEPLIVTIRQGAAVIRLNDSLGRQETIEAFDQAMARLADELPVVLDLTNTASGGNTSVARAIMSWFVERPTSYQVHRLPSEESDTGIARQWIEQVLPRDGKHHSGPLTVRVGRWTGSMGEGLAIGLDAIGARVEGDQMAGLLGAVYDYQLPQSGVVIKLPAERLFGVDGTPREKFRPIPSE